MHHLLDASGAVMGSRLGWEQPNWFAPPGVPREYEYSFGDQNWRPYVDAEHRALRGRVGLLDQTAFTKLLVTGSDATDVLQFLCANDVAVPVGTTVYTGLLNDRGGYESDVTITRTGSTEYLLVTGTTQATRDLHYLQRHVPAGSPTRVVDVTSAYAVFGVMGPRSRDLLGQLTKTNLSDAAFPFYTSQLIELGPVPCRATRVSYVGDLGWELYVLTEYAVAAYEQLRDAGEDFALALVGHYAVDAMRIEKGYRAWARELTPDTNPVEAGLSLTCKLRTEVPFRGRDAVVRAKAEGVARRLVCVTVDGDQTTLWGGELLLRDGEPVGFLTSGTRSAQLGMAVGMAYMENSEDPVTPDYVRTGAYELEVAGSRFPARVSLAAPFDPKGERLRA